MSSFQNQSALEQLKSGENVEDHFTGCGSSVDAAIVDRAKADVLALQFFNDFYEVFQGATEAIETPDEEGIS